jgi:DNA invertase Pin-like site-specific DNA recombinase
MKAKLYARVSTDKQESSVDQQIKELQDFWARLNIDGYEVEYLIDENVSGGTELFDRPQGSKLKDLESGSIVICYKRDRMFRNVINALQIVYKWLDDGVTIYFIENGIEPLTLENPNSKFIFTILCAKDELEKDTTALRTRLNMKFRKENGRTYSSAPYGWTNEGERGNNGKIIDGKLIPNEKEQAVIKMIKDLKESKYTLGAIADKLNFNNIPSKKGGTWSSKTVSDVLNNSLNQ